MPTPRHAVSAPLTPKDRLLRTMLAQGLIAVMQARRQKEH